MWKWLTEALGSIFGSGYDDSPEKMVADVLGEKIRFSVPPDLAKNFRVVEVDLDKFLAVNRKMVPKLNELNPRQRQKIEKIKTSMAYSDYVMHMPETMGVGLHDGYHRLAVLEQMGLKVVPMLVHKNDDLTDFLKRYGVDKPYYRIEEGGKKPVRYWYNGDVWDIQVEVFQAIDRKAVKTTPGAYKPPSDVENPPGMGENVERLRNDGSGRQEGGRDVSPRPEGPTERE